MSSYYRIIIVSLFLMTTIYAKSAYNIQLQNDKKDILMLQALDYELREQFAQSLVLYNELFNMTSKEEYLSKAISSAIALKDLKTLQKLTVENLDRFPNLNERLYRLAIMTYLQYFDIKNALKLSKGLIGKYDNPINKEIVGNVYYLQGNYHKAKNYFSSAYKVTKNPKILLSLVDVLSTKLDKQDIAISMINKHIDKYGCNILLCNKLIQLYKKDKNVQDILIVMEKLYQKTKEKELLAKIAIFKFELAKDKKAILQEVLNDFNIAITPSIAARYKNYYGYLLIDYSIDIKKGIDLVKEALEKEPTNLAFLDSLAWGYYKLGQYKTAYKYMKQIVDKVGSKNKEIKIHWDKIQEHK